MVRRGRIEIQIQLLKHISSGISKPSALYYKIETNHTHGQLLLRSLVAKKLVREVDHRSFKGYYLTAEGSKLLEMGEILIKKIL